VEVCKGSTASHESDMGLSHTNAISPLCCAGGDLSVIMERSKDVGIRNAKVRAPLNCSCTARLQDISTTAQY